MYVPEVEKLVVCPVSALFVMLFTCVTMPSNFYEPYASSVTFDRLTFFYFGYIRFFDIRTDIHIVCICHITRNIGCKNIVTPLGVNSYGTFPFDGDLIYGPPSTRPNISPDSTYLPTGIKLKYLCLLNLR